MLNSKRTFGTFLGVAGAAALLSPLGTAAQTNLLDGSAPASLDGRSNGNSPLLRVTVDSSHTFKGEAKFRGVNHGDSSAFNVNVSGSSSVQLDEQWMLPFELQSQNLWLKSLTGVPIPDRVHTLRFGTGLGYRANERWVFMARVSPMLYKFEDVGANDIGLSGGLMAEWRYSPSLKWIFGVMVSPDSTLPVLPVAGVDWVMNEQWELQLLFPRPRLVYSIADQWKLHAGMDLNLGTAFRTSDRLGTSIGLPRYNDALGSYRDIRLGIGAGYQLSKSSSVEVEAGYSVSREIDYTRIDEEVEFDPAPYFRVGVRLRF